MGNIHLVDGLSPRDFSVSKYWRLMVRPSAVEATALIRSRASLNPDALSTAVEGEMNASADCIDGTVVAANC